MPIIFSICCFSDIFGKGRTSSLVFSNLRQSSRIFGSLQKSSVINCRKNDGQKLLDILNKIILAFLEPFCFFLEKIYCFKEFFTVSVKMPKFHVTKPKNEVLSVIEVPPFRPSLNFISLLRVVITPSVRGENDSKQSNEIQDNSDLP